MKNKVLFIIFSFMLLHSVVLVKADNKDVNAKYEYQKSSTVFDTSLNGNNNLNVGTFNINIKNNSYDNGKTIVFIPVEDERVIESHVANTDNYDAFYVDFYNSNNRVNINNPVVISSVSGGSYEDANISVISTSGELLYEGSITNNSFSFQITGKCYILFNYEVGRRGDINQDNLININDLVQLRRHLAGIKLLTGKSLTFADINKDDRVNINDLVKLRKYLAGLEEL